MNLGYTISGFAVGLLVGVTGVGGGSLMTPLLVFLFGFNPAVAVGTDLLFAALTKTGGVWVHHGKHGSVDWRIVGWMGLGSIPFALITLLARARARCRGSSPRTRACTRPSARARRHRPR